MRSDTHIIFSFYAAGESIGMSWSPFQAAVGCHLKGWNSHNSIFASDSLNTSLSSEF